MNTARLEDGSDVLHLVEPTWWVQQIDVGYPTVRTVQELRAGADGVYDSTQFFGARVVTMFVRGTGNRRERFEELSRFMRPISRPFLYFNLDGSERRIGLRANNRAAAFVAPTDSQEFLLQWVAPDGVVESAVETVAVAQASSGVEDGREYDLTFDRVYAATSPVGSVLVNNQGTTCGCIDIQLFGPCVNPRLENLTTGEQLRFEITLGANQWLQVSTRDRTVLLNNLPAQNRYNTLDFTVSRWVSLPPGESLIRYRPDSATAGAFARVSFRSSWI